MTTHTKITAASSGGFDALLGVKLFGDGASLEEFTRLYEEGRITGFTTNPTLMFKAGVRDYEAFAKQLLQIIPDLPLSFEVFSDDIEEMERQARLIASWGDNVYVKVPVMNTQRVSTLPMVKRLSKEGIKVNVTAILSLEQAEDTIAALDKNTPAIVSIFAGRIADTGVDPVPVMKEAVRLAKAKPKAEILWASTREVLNVYQARDAGVQIITAPADIFKKLSMQGQDLEELSQETVQMFRKDAVAAGFTLSA